MIVTCVEEHMLDTSLKMRVSQYTANNATNPRYKQNWINGSECVITCTSLGDLTINAASNPACHTDLNQLVNRLMSYYCPGGPQDNRGYVHLSSQIIEDSNSHLDSIYTKSNNAMEMFTGCPGLKDHLCDAWKSKCYQEIGNINKFYPQSNPATRTHNDRSIVVARNKNKNARYFIRLLYKCATE